MELYSSGNSLYALGDYVNAVQLYTQGLQQHLLKDELYVKLLLNRAQCYLRGEQYSEALKDCSMAISTVEYDSADTSTQQLLLKAYLRRAQTHEHLGNYSKALADVEYVLQLDPPANLRKPALASRSKLRTFVEVDHKVSLSEGRPKMMVTDQQALRLAFIEQPPETFVLGESYLVRLCITNELGLWDRDFIRRSFASVQNSSSKDIGQNCNTLGRLESIADMQCTMSVFDLNPVDYTNDSNSVVCDMMSTNVLNHSNDGLFMEMKTCPSSTNSSSMSIGEDGKIDLYITLRQAQATPSSEEVVPSYMSMSLAHIAVMLRFSLDRPLPSSGEVLPVLSLPARVTLHPTKDTTVKENTLFNSTAGTDRSSAYEKVIELCRSVHATCVRQILLTHTTTAPIAPVTGDNSTYTENTCSNAATNAATSTTNIIASPTYNNKLNNNAFSAYALESPGYLGIAGKVWDSMYVLLQYLAIHQAELVRGKRIIELGCGTGLAGISLCPMQPASVVLTDMPEVVPLISANILLNSVVMGDDVCQQVLLHRYAAKAYTWGGELHSCQQEEVYGNAKVYGVNDGGDSVLYKVPYFDTILASDVVYYPEGYAPLLATLCDLLGATDTESSPRSAATERRSHAPVCILAHRHRHPEDKNFFDALYAVPELCTEKLDFQVQHTGSSDVHALQDVVLFKITKRV